MIRRSVIILSHGHKNQTRTQELLEKSSSSDRLDLLWFVNGTQAAVSASYSDRLDLLRSGNEYLLVVFVNSVHSRELFIGSMLCTK